MRALTSPEFASDAAIDAGALSHLAEPLEKLPRSAPSAGFADDPAPAAYPPPVPAGRRRTWLAMGLTVATAVGLLLWATARLTGPAGIIPFFQAHDDLGQPGANSATAGGASASSASGAAANVLPIVAVHDYDPFGDDGSEDPSHAALAANGNRDDGWSTSGYKAPLSLIGKKGVGLVVDLGQPAAGHEVTVTFDQPGTVWELRTADTASPDFGATKGVGPGTVGAAVSTVTIPGGVSSRFWIVWLTTLPLSGDGTYRSEIREISIR
jgi:putative peptidoglycan lipid II flippase